MFSKSATPSFMRNTTKRQESASSQAGEGAKRLGAFGSAMTEKKKKPADDDPIKRIQRYSAAENERKRKEDAEKKKKKSTPPSVEPSKGFFGRMYDKYVGGKKDE